MFFVLSLSLLLSGIYMLYDEMVGRRPWKDYQERFYQIQVQMFSRELELATAELESDTKESQAYDLSRERLVQLYGKDSRYLQKKNFLSKKLDKRRSNLDRAIESYRLKKAELDEVRYRIERIMKGEETEATKNRLDESFAALQKEVEVLEGTVSESQTDLDLADKEFGDWVHGENILREEVQSYEVRIKFLAERKKAIEDRYLSLTTGVGFEEHFIPRADAIKQLTNEDLGVVDRCTTCHMGIAQVGFENQPQPFATHPRLKELLFANHSNIGCTPCHHGRGRALTVESAHGLEKHWQWPMKEGVFVESSCLGCHPGVIELEGAPNLSQGLRLVQRHGCFGCHPMNTFEWEKVGPALNYTAAKTDISWLTRWIEDPKGYLPDTPMPDFSLRRDEALAIAQYLIDSASPTDLPQIDLSLGDPIQGQRLVQEIGCLGCHSVDPKDTNRPPGAGPNLSEVGSKAPSHWIYSWLKNPNRFDPSAKMPNLRISDEEALHLTAYLTQLRAKKELNPMATPPTLHEKQDLAERGRVLISRYGCFGCHDINGFEGQPRVGEDLSAWGDKDIHLLEFGYVDIPKTRQDWILRKLKSPRSFEEGRMIHPDERLRMPAFNLTDEDRRALAVAVTGFSKEPIPDVRRPIPEPHRAIVSERTRHLEAGRQIIRKYNCVGCHQVERIGEREYWGGDIQARLSKPEDFPPPLYGEGDKVQPEWLFNFLLDVKEIRPWLTIRMPDFTFTEDEALSLVRYFSASGGRERNPYDNMKGKVFDPVVVEAGKQLFHGFQCISCHPVSGEMLDSIPDKTTLAPNLELVPDRLRYDWLHGWILNPERVQPGTKMPSFFIEGKSYAHLMLGQPQFADIKVWFDQHYSPEQQQMLLQDPDWVIGAVRDFLWNFDANDYLSKFPWTPPVSTLEVAPESGEAVENEFE